jgi:hypothetical protein
MTGSYDNRTGQTLPKGAMVHLILLFAPDQLEEWPRVDPGESDFAKDLMTLKSLGDAMQGGHNH